MFPGVAMSINAEQIIKDALTLPAVERASIAEELLSSLDRPDATIDQLWAKEAEDRLSAFEAGKMKAIPAEDVFAEYDQP
jgi:putative addiction module component (TIGR02574 family)